MSEAGKDSYDCGHRHAVMRVLDCMGEDLSAALPLAELARIGMFSPFHFHRVFRTVTSETPGRFLAALRMAEARRLLLHSGLTVAAISGRVGYTSVGTFTTQFTRLVGVSPERFRRLVRDLPAQEVPSAGPPHPGGPDAVSVVSAAVHPAEPDGLLLAGIAGAGTTGDATDWTISPGVGPVALALRPPGRYRLQVVLLRSRWSAAAALVDQNPDSYLVGRTAFVIPERVRRPLWTAVQLRAPQPTDPPLLSVTPLRLLAERLSAPVAVPA
jgi:AraC family transcriptional regulator